METISDDIVVEKLRELLQNADMETTTGNNYNGHHALLVTSQQISSLALQKGSCARPWSSS